jgi:transposase
MEVRHPRCAGLDVHKDVVVACVRIQEGAVARHVVESFGTTTTALLALNDWLDEHAVTHVAMEATGVYWKPVWHVIEGSFELVLANAMHVKNVPGRKTDVNDATWIADLLAHGLIRLRQGAPWLKATLTQAAWSAARAKRGYLRAQFLRLEARRGPKKAIMPVAASMLTATFYMLRDDVDFRDLGTDYFDRADRTKTANRLVRKLAELGYAVDLERAA